MTINGGSVTAVCYGDSAGIGGGPDGAGGTIIINDGSVTAESTGNGAGIGCGAGGTGGNITINGGKVTSTNGIGAGASGTGGSIELGCAHISDSIYSTGYSSESGSVTISEGQVLAAYGENGELQGSYSGTVSCTNIAGKTLVPYRNKIEVNDPYGAGTVTVDKTTAATGDIVTITAVPQAGFRLAKLAVGMDDASKVFIPAVKVNSYTYTFKMPDTNVFIDSEFTVISEPAFSGHALLLSGEIGVEFRVDFPDGYEKDGVYMTFSVSDGRTESMTIDKADMINENSYYFICYVNALEIADSITATLHYGTRTKGNKYSVMDYCSYVQQHQSSFREELVTLTGAIQDYGYYMQKSGWTDSMGAHTAVPAVNTLDEDSIAAAREGVSGMGIVFDPGDSGIANASFSLTLNSDTRINVFLQPDDGVEVTSSGYTKITRGGATWYKYTSKSIGVGNLGKMYQYKAATSAGGEASVTVSAMSYVKEALDPNSTFTQAKQYAMTAYYNYYKTAIAYRDSKT